MSQRGSEEKSFFEKVIDWHLILSEKPKKKYFSSLNGTLKKICNSIKPHMEGRNFLLSDVEGTRTRRFNVELNVTLEYINFLFNEANKNIF